MMSKTKSEIEVGSLWSYEDPMRDDGLIFCVTYLEGDLIKFYILKKNDITAGSKKTFQNQVKQEMFKRIY